MSSKFDFKMFKIPYIKIKNNRYILKLSFLHPITLKI